MAENTYTTIDEYIALFPADIQDRLQTSYFTGMSRQCRAGTYRDRWLGLLVAMTKLPGGRPRLSAWAATITSPSSESTDAVGWPRRRDGHNERHLDGRPPRYRCVGAAAPAPPGFKY